MYHNFLDNIVDLSTPYYCYDLSLLRNTIGTIQKEISGFPFVVHYAVKANANPRILEEISKTGLGADLVSGNEILAALKAGFAPG